MILSLIKGGGSRFVARSEERIARRDDVLNSAVSFRFTAPRLNPKLARRAAGDFMKDKPEVTLIAKAELLPDLCDRPVGSGEQGLRLCDPLMVKVGNEWLPRHLPEEPCEMRFAHMNRGCGFFDGDEAFERVVDQFKQGAEALDIIFPAVEGGQVQLEVRVVVHEENQNCFEKGSSRQAFTATLGRELAVDTLHEPEDFGGHPGTLAHHM